jgi:hypothetical protein
MRNVVVILSRIIVLSNSCLAPNVKFFGEVSHAIFAEDDLCGSTS